MTENPLRDLREDRVVEVGEHRVALAYDPDAAAWFVRSSTVPGLAAQAGSLDDLVEQLPLLVRQAALP